MAPGPTANSIYPMPGAFCIYRPFLFEVPLLLSAITLASPFLYPSDMFLKIIYYTWRCLVGNKCDDSVHTFIISEKTKACVSHPPCDYKSWPLGLQVTSMTLRSQPSYLKSEFLLSPGEKSSFIRKAPNPTAPRTTSLRRGPHGGSMSQAGQSAAAFYLTH